MTTLSVTNNQEPDAGFPINPRRIGAAGLFGLLALLSLVSQGAARAQTDAPAVAAPCDTTIAAKIAGLNSNPTRNTGWTSVIVRLDSPLTPERERRLSALKADIYKRLSLISSVALRVPTRNLKALTRLPFVLRLSADAEVRKNDAFTTEHSGATVAQGYGYGGYGVTVAVVDSGVAAHDDLASGGGWCSQSRVAARATFSPRNRYDDCGHGTHIAGIIAGNGARSSGPHYFRTFYGIAPAAQLVDVRVLDRQGSGTVSNVISGLNWVIQNKSRYNIRVINLSLGHSVGESYKTDPLCLAVEAAYRAGIVVVCAAGNTGRESAVNKPGVPNEGWGTAYGSIQSPANDPYVITVGAMKQNAAYPNLRAQDRIATYSSRGPSQVDFVLKPDLVAPGNRVISLNVSNSWLETSFGATNGVRRSYYAYTTSTDNSTQYFNLSGTSMAAPVVAGAVALMLEKEPWLSPDTVKARLMISADKWRNPDGTTDPCTYGAGFLNIPAAMSNRLIARNPALSPSLARGSDGRIAVDPTQVIWGPPRNNESSIWGISGVQSYQVIWGGAIQNAQVVSGSQVIWGGVVKDTNRLITAGVWSNQVIWGGLNTNVDLSSVAITGEQ